MKRLIGIITLSTLLSLPLAGQETKTNSLSKITAAQAKEHIGSEKIVTGKIAEVNKGEKLVRLNLDKPFPQQLFTAVIFATKTNLFEDLDKLKGKKVEVSGKITEYSGRPQIVLVSTNQLKVLEGEKEEKAK